MSTPHFQMYTSSGEGDARRALQHFERVRGFFVQQTTREETESDPIEIIAFRNEKEFKPFRPNEIAAAFYLTDRDSDQIVMGGFGDHYEATATHEFVHLLVARAGMKLPVWLNEGLAELYETLAPQGDKVLVGTPGPGQAASVRQGRWLSLETLTTVGMRSAYYNEKDKANTFYAQSWLLTHMLALSEEYGTGFPKCVAAFARGDRAENVFQAIYGKSLEQVEKDLHGYPSNLRIAILATKMEKFADKPEVEPLDPLEAELIQAKLLARVGKIDEADRRFAEYQKQRPDDWRAEEALGYRYWRWNDLEPAREHFARAVELGSTNARMYFEYSALARQAGTKSAEVIPLLKKAVELDPEYREAHFMLGQYLLGERDYEAALRQFSLVKKVTPERALPLFHNIALAYIGMDKLDEAEKAADRARQYARTPEEQTQVEGVSTYLRQVREQNEYRRQMAERRSMPQDALVGGVKDSGRPRLSREPGWAVEEPARVPVEKKTIRVEGSLQSVDCLGQRARLNVYVDGELRSFAVYDPTSVVLKGTDGAVVELTCSQQKLTPVVVEYEPREDGELGTIGAVRVLEFN